MCFFFVLSTQRPSRAKALRRGAIKTHQPRAGERAVAGHSPAPLATRSLLMPTIIIPHFLSVPRFLGRPRLLTRIAANRVKNPFTKLGS